MSRKSKRPESKWMKSAGKPASSGEIAFNTIVDAESYTRPLRRELSRLDKVADPRRNIAANKVSLAAAVKEMRQLIRDDFRDDTIPDFYLDDVQNAITPNSVSLVRFCLRALERQIMCVIVECEIERLDPTWSKRKSGRPPLDLKKARDFVKWHKQKPNKPPIWIVEQEMCLNPPSSDHYDAIYKGLRKMEANGEDVKAVRAARNLIDDACHKRR